MARQDGLSAQLPQGLHAGQGLSRAVEDGRQQLRPAGRTDGVAAGGNDPGTTGEGVQNILGLRRPDLFEDFSADIWQLGFVRKYGDAQGGSISLGAKPLLKS
jgi:hypothetical protein